MDSEVVVAQQGSLGRITLNRPKVLNALTHPMIRAVRTALATWRDDDAIATVVIDGAGDRGLCAGADIRLFHEDMVRRTGMALAFLADEYRMNAELAGYPKPIVALMDGIVMGGGVGISAHCSHRVVSEHTVLAMPEVLIGFTPDVGASMLLARAPGELGTHMALTNHRLTPQDAINCGFADALVPLERRDALLAQMVNGADQAIDATYQVPQPGPLLAQQSWIDGCYTADSVEEILERLETHSDPRAQEAASSIRKLSPTALRVTLRSIREARQDDDIADALTREYRIAARSVAVAKDFREGIDCRIISKGRQPVWDPPALEQVTDVTGYFQPPASGDLSLAP